MGNPLNVQRRKRGVTLQNKTTEYANMFNLNVALIAQDKTTGDYEIFQPNPDENFPPARKDIDPRILHFGHEGNFIVIKGGTKPSNNPQLQLLRIQKRISELKVPKPPSKNLQSQLLRMRERISRLKVPKAPSRPSSNA
ncbi:hypothetical protein F5B21DRAFT_46006 [Xylaria acuta]|nr:hypothetical protein F5B21DRAFT_46006 [Xylaria acuta]